ncbi:MAG: transporter [Thermodesulfobacteria bacterium]|nr:transporter [Thermodesulfobacteriota bacterium]
MQQKSLWSLLVFLLAAFCSANVYSAGFQLFNELSARTASLGAAMTARTDVVESAWFNPAVSAMLDGPQVMAGMAAVIPQMKLESDDYRADMKDKVYPVPHAYAATPLGDKFGVSMAINMPYGLTTEWDNDWRGKYYAVYTELRCLFISPAVAIRPLEWLSFSAGPNFVYATADMRKALTPQIPGLKTNMNGEDWAYGYTVSMIAKPFKDWSFGVTYHSQVDIGLSGTARYTMDLPGFQKSKMWLDVSLPRTVSIGVATTAIKDFTFSMDIVWTDWSSYDRLDFVYESAPGTGQPGVISVPRNWEDAWAFKFGAEYTYSKMWQFRAAYVYDKSPIKDKYREPTLPTNDRHVFSVGLGWNYKHLGVDASYTYVLVENGGTSPMTPGLDGTYKGQAHIIGTSFRWSF